MLPKRKHLRLKNYDYSQPGAYFVTICCQKRQPIFGNIDEPGEMNLNDIGHMIDHWYHKIENKFPAAKCDEFICMPDHVHMIIQILPMNGHDCGATHGSPPTNPMLNNHFADSLMKKRNVGADPRVRPLANLFQIIQWFKTQTTNEYIKGVRRNKWPPFDGKLWQRGYYEHVIRNEEELAQTRQYIINNPVMDHDDEQ